MLSERPRGTLSETRKITKSAMEKKRRARINTSLVELKTILGGMISHKTERFDKMEKADILEMTVTYVKQLQRKSEQSSSPVKNKDEDYKNGVNSCISEVIKYIASSSSCDDEIKSKLLDHLANRLTGVDKTSVRQECKTSCSPTNVNLEPSSPQPVSVLNTLEINTNPTPAPTHINTPTVCPTAISLSPGSNASQLNFQGQLTGTTLQTGTVVNTLQQASPAVPNIPLTIIVPANLYPSVSGTACVIPLNIPTTCTASHVPVISQPSNNVLKTVSPITNQNCDSSMIVIGNQLPTQCVPGISMNTISEMKSDASTVDPVIRVQVPCNIERANVPTENSSLQSHNCLNVRNNPVTNDINKEHLETEQLWRPW